MPAAGSIGVVPLLKRMHEIRIAAYLQRRLQYKGSAALNWEAHMTRNCFMTFVMHYPPRLQVLASCLME